MNNKICPVCKLEITEPKKRYHPDCFKRYRKEYQKKFWVIKKSVRFNVETLKGEVDQIVETVKQKVLEELKKKK